MLVKPLIWPKCPGSFDHNGIALILLNLPADTSRADARKLARETLKKAAFFLLPDQLIELFETPHGPRFSPSCLHVSLSYAGDKALIGISSKRTIGVDIVRIEKFPEIEALSRLYLPKIPACDADFALAWAKVEACCKALNLPLAEIDETRIRTYASCILPDCEQIDSYSIAVALRPFNSSQ